MRWALSRHFSACSRERESKEISEFALGLQRCGNAKALTEGRQLHDRIIRSGFGRDRFLQNLLVQMYGRCGALEDARAVFDDIHNRNSFSWNLMISAYNQHDRVKEALDLFQHMPCRDVVSWTAMVAAYCHQGNLRKALCLFQQMPERDMVSWNAMIVGHAQQGRLADALRLFAQMPVRNISSWSAVLGAYAQKGYAMEAFQVLLQMQLQGMMPNHLTLGSILYACRNASMIDQGCHYLVSLSQCYGLRCHLEHHNCVIDLVARFHWLDEAEALINSMSCCPDAASWTAILGCCRAPRDLIQANRAAKNVFELEPNNSAPYLLLLSLYHIAGKRHNLMQIRKEFEEPMDSVFELQD